MKKSLLTPLLTLLVGAAFGADPETKPPQTTPGPQTTVTRKATITIDVNGQKQTREIDLGKVDLGNAVQIKVGDGSGVSGVTINTAGTQTAAVRRTWLGVSADELSDEVRAQLPLPDGTGLLVRSVVADSPAAQAGLLKNDVLAKFDDQILTNAKQLRTLVGTKKEGDTVRLTYLRKGREATAEVKLGSHEGEEAGDDAWGLSKWLGADWVKKVVGPIVSSVVVTDNDGHVIATQGQPDMSETEKQLEKTMRAAGVDEKVIEQMKKSLADTAAAIQKAAGDISAAKGDVSRDLQNAVDEAKQAVEQAKREAEEAARKSTPPEQKAP